jgi:hypothetical protein
MPDEQTGLGSNPVPDADPADERADALKDADVTSGKVGAEEAYPPRKGETKEASDTTPQEAGSF